jgi:hypothetical protein
MTKKLTTLQDLQKIDPTIQEIINPYKEIPNINEDDDSRTVICVVFVYNNIYCKVLVDTKKGGFAGIQGTSFLDNNYKGHNLCIESKSKISLMKSEYELYNLYNTSMCSPCKFFVCDTNKAREIVKFIYYGHETHYRKIMVYALIFIWCCLVLFELLGGARFAGI